MTINFFRGFLLLWFMFISMAGWTLIEPVYLADDYELDLPQNHSAQTEISDVTAENYLEQTDISKDLMDRSRDWLVRYLDGLSGDIDAFFVDSFFSEEITTDDVKGSRAKLSFYTRRVLGEPVDYKFGLSVKLVLPNTNERLNLLLESEDEDARESNPVESVENTNYSAALRFIINETDRWKTNLDTGVRWRIPPVAFVRFRARRFSYFSEWEMKTTQTLSYFSDEGWSALTRVQGNYPINIKKQFRLSAQADYLLNDDYFKLSYGAGLYHRLSTKAALGFVAGAAGNTQNGATFDAYNAGVRYRRQVWKNYVFAEVSPELIWTSDYDYESTPVITFRLETVFNE